MSTTPRPRLLALLAALALPAAAALAAEPARADVSGAAIVSFLNAQRAAQGIPAGITEVPALSQACAAHNRYGELNGVLEHSEDPSKPGYTPAGAAAAAHSVLSAGDTAWTATHNPFESAPIHMHQLLAPRLYHMGASQNADHGCATTQDFDGSSVLAGTLVNDRPPPPSYVTYTYPGDGATGWRTSEVASEGPFTPGQKATPPIPKGARTGPYLLVMFDGPDISQYEQASHASATLTGPDGPVDVAVVDNTTPGVGQYLPPGAQIIPREPLAPGTTYTARITAMVTTDILSGPARSFSHSWSFTTAGSPERAPAELEVRRAHVRHGRLEVRARMSGKAAGERVKVSFRAGGRQLRFTRKAGSGGRLRFSKRLRGALRHVRRGRLVIRYAGSDTVLPARARLHVAPRPARLEVRRARLHGKSIKVTGTVSRRARGQVRLALTWSRQGGGSRSWKGKAKIRRHRWRVTAKLPRGARAGGSLRIAYAGRGAVAGEQQVKRLG